MKTTTMMKFKNVFAAALPLLAVAGAVVSCNDYDNGYSEKALVYAQEFETTYGSVDPDQDWNLAMRGSVTVTVAKPSKVTVYALVNGIYSIVGDYTGVTATQKLEFDVLEGTTQLIVTDGTQGIHTTVGGSVSFGGGSSAHTRAANEGNNLSDKNGQGTNISVTTGQYINFTKEEAKKYEEVLPELNDPECTYEASNLSHKITKNFKYVSKGKFTFYPVYWQTGAANEVGIYYYDAQGQYHEVKIYDIKSGGELLNVYGDNHTEPVPAEDESSTAGYDRGVVSQRAQAITIDIPEGTVFGFYLINTFAGKSNTFYSEAERNPQYPSRFGEGYMNEHGCYTASVTIDGSKYLCFEDWLDGDFDLNDVVFKFVDNAPTTIDEDPDAASWILACEDLGGSFDWDFNDVIFKVTHISGRETATITPLAAGGTLASYIFFDNPNTSNQEETCLGEIHQLIGSGSCVSGEYIPYNVYNTRGTAGKSLTINVDKDWTMAHYSSESYDTNEQYREHNMGGFSIRVLKAKTPAKDNKPSINDPDFGLASIVAAPGQGDAPQMICLPATYELGEWTYEWAWSRELMTMADGQGKGSYPRFAGWVNDHKTNTDWYKYPNDNPVTTVAEKKWKTPSAEPEPVKKTTPTIGGEPSFTGDYNVPTVTGNQVFVMPSGSQLTTVLDLDGKYYAATGEGQGTFSVTIDKAGTNSTVELMNWGRNVLRIHAENPNNKEAIVTVTVSFSGDDNYYPTSVTYTVLIPKKVYLTSHVNADDWALAIENGKLFKQSGFKIDTAQPNQTWYKLPIVNAKGQPVYEGYFWLCNAGTKQFITIDNKTAAVVLTTALPANEVPNKTNIPTGTQGSYFHYYSATSANKNGLGVMYPSWSNHSFAITDFTNLEVIMRQNSDTDFIIDFKEKP